MSAHLISPLSNHRICPLPESYTLSLASVNPGVVKVPGHTSIPVLTTGIAIMGIV